MIKFLIKILKIIKHCFRTVGCNKKMNYAHCAKFQRLLLLTKNGKEIISGLSLK